ncbi:hypothetical protein RIVM261_013260 [Rivularia sp. IAM M-261]|nr:hypothetical protein CAL7716_072110 [Calothrix sp. PCC 7716]GJD16370.1 hypothetical protein RIVM261_013260 [Rivularia sp. IAM M-261]
MYRNLEGCGDVTAAPATNYTSQLIYGLIACFLVIGLGAFLGLVLFFVPFIFIIKLADRQTEQAKITKTYESLMKRYYNNTLFNVQ